MGRAIRFLMLFLTLLGGVASNARPSLAEDVDGLIKRGIELRRKGKEQEALEVFQRAAQVSRVPRVVGQIALAEQALGMWADAERDLTEALAGGDKEPWVAKNRRQLEEALRVIQNHLGSLEIWGEPPGTEVVVDGAVVAKLPMSTPLRLPSGEISLMLRKDGYDKITRTVSIAKGDRVRENVVLHKTVVAPVERKPLALDVPRNAEPSGDTPASSTTLKAISTPPPPPHPEETERLTVALPAPRSGARCRSRRCWWFRWGRLGATRATWPNSTSRCRSIRR